LNLKSEGKGKRGKKEDKEQNEGENADSVQLRISERKTSTFSKTDTWLEERGRQESLKERKQKSVSGQTGCTGA